MSAKPVSAAPVAPVPITSIVVGERRRERLGKLQRLAASIATHGLIHPILLRGQTLVAGHRRLEACRSLGFTTIPARQVEHLSDDELRAIELDENVHREALSDFATSKQRLAQIRQAEADLKAEAEKELRPTPGRNSKRGRGRPKEPGSKRTVQDATGISRSTQVETEKHVTLAERYPALQRPGWHIHNVLEAGTVLEQLPERERSRAASLIDQDAVPPKIAIGILSNLATMPTDERREVFTLAQSDDPVLRETALTKAAALPPPVDPGLTLLGDAHRTLTKAAQQCRSLVIKPQLADLATSAGRVYAAFQEVNTHERRAFSGREQTIRSAASDSRSL